MKKSVLSLLFLFILFPFDDLISAEEGIDDIVEKQDQKEKVKFKEIVKGLNTKTGIGYFIYLGTLFPETSPGTIIDLSAGYDILDISSLGISLDLTFYQGINRANPNSAIVQGNFRSTMGHGALKFSYFFIPRFCTFINGGGGVFYSEKLKEQGTIHGGVKFYGSGGLGTEYYTKLSHFSLGIEADFFYIIGVDYAISIYPFVKYTF